MNLARIVSNGRARIRQAVASLLLLALPVACGRAGIDIYAVTAPDPDAPEDDQDAGGDPAVDAEGEDLDAAPATVDPDAGSARDASGELRHDASSPDAARDGAVPPDAQPAALALRYDFGGTGTTVQDRIGNAHAQILGGAQLDGSGRLVLDGNNDFVNLPNGVISRWSSVTVMAWLTWNGGPCWQRVFDFGSNSGGEDNVGNASSSLSLSAASCPNNVVSALLELNGNVRAVNGPALTMGSALQLALVVDGARGLLTLYLNGAQVGESMAGGQLAQLNDVNNWLGRSQWVQDRFLAATFDELRVYAGALSAAEIAGAYARGANAP
jgi:hypothetical protein